MTVIGGVTATRLETAMTTTDATAAATTAGIETEIGTGTAGGIARALGIGAIVGAHAPQAATEATIGGMQIGNVNTDGETTVGRRRGGSAGTGAYEGA